MSAIAGGPQHPLRVLVNGADVDGGSVLSPGRLGQTLIQANQTVLRSNPDVPLRILDDSRHVVVGQETGRPKFADVAVLELKHTLSIRAYPQTAVGTLGHGANGNSGHDLTGSYQSVVTSNRVNQRAFDERASPRAWCEPPNSS